MSSDNRYNYEYMHDPAYLKFLNEAYSKAYFEDESDWESEFWIWVEKKNEPEYQKMIAKERRKSRTKSKH